MIFSQLQILFTRGREGEIKTIRWFVLWLMVAIHLAMILSQFVLYLLTYAYDYCRSYQIRCENLWFWPLKLISRRSANERKQQNVMNIYIHVISCYLLSFTVCCCVYDLLFFSLSLPLFCSLANRHRLFLSQLLCLNSCACPTILVTRTTYF